jgi:hypothetical protein
MRRPQYGDANWAPSEGSSTQLELRIKQQRNSSLRKPPRSGSQFQQRWRWISPSRAHWPGNQVPPPEWGTVREKKQSEEGGEGGIQSGSRALTVRARRDSSPPPPGPLPPSLDPGRGGAAETGWRPGAAVSPLRGARRDRGRWWGDCDLRLRGRASQPGEMIWLREAAWAGAARGGGGRSTVGSGERTAGGAAAWLASMIGRAHPGDSRVRSRSIWVRVASREPRPRQRATAANAVVHGCTAWKGRATPRSPTDFPASRFSFVDSRSNKFVLYKFSYINKMK